jgi:Amidohydrolase
MTEARPLPTQEITVRTDTREILANARRDTEKFGLDDYYIVDVDSHHVELDSWPEIIEYVEDPVLRDMAKQMMKDWPTASHLALHNHVAGLTLQDVGGRIPHQATLGEYVPEGDVHRVRQSDAPLLTKLPSDYMREMYYTSQPMEITDLDLLESTFRAMDAENTLMYSSDWPHWDFDLPGRLFHSLPFLSDKGRRNILGENARRVFGL